MANESDLPFFLPRVTPQEERPYVAAELRGRGIKRRGWLKALSDLEKLQQQYDESEGSDTAVEGELSEQLRRVWGMIADVTTGQASPPSLKKGRGLDFNPERGLPESREANLADRPQPGPIVEPSYPQEPPRDLP